jgi:hypothetical protein
MRPKSCMAVNPRPDRLPTGAQDAILPRKAYPVTATEITGGKCSASALQVSPLSAV